MIAKLRHGPSVAVGKINELINAVNLLSRMTGDGLILVKSTSKGKTIGLSLDALRSRIGGRGGGFGGAIRIAYCTEDAQSDNIMEAELDEVDSGDAIEVTCLIAVGGTALDEASPRLIDEDPMMVILVAGTWYCATVFMKTDDCVCVEDQP